MSEKEFSSTRVFGAPRELVWNAWTEPGHLAQWWRLEGFRNSLEEFSLKQNGVLRFTMHGPDGSEYENKIVFVDIIQPERIVLDHVSGPHFRVIATFDELDNRTRISFRVIFESASACDRVKAFALEANERHFDHLAGQLEKIGVSEMLHT